MKLTYFGTAAAEGFPAVFCHCPHCREARRLGGKSIRTRSQAMVNDDLLIDLPADTYAHFLQNGVEGDKIAYLLITHSHPDHLYAGELMMRGGAYAHDMRAPTLRILASRTVAGRLGRLPEGAVVTVGEAYRTVDLGPYRVTPLPARHMTDGEEAFFYLIEGERSVLYAHDTGYFYDGVFAYLEERRLPLDLVSLDCTNVDIPIGDEGRHMGLANIARLLDRLRAISAVTDKTAVYLNHFSHNAGPLHEALEERVRPYGWQVAYDGCCVTL